MYYYDTYCVMTKNMDRDWAYLKVIRKAKKWKPKFEWVGSCFGDDTFNNGVGHCFKDPPPEWACLADCKKLFNSSAAWCYYDYPTGKARCMDHLCTKPEAFSCHVDYDGKVCRYGDCVVECNDNSDCDTKGYPDNFECVSHRCEYAF
jgi:hypothetical protein